MPKSACNKHWHQFRNIYIPIFPRLFNDLFSHVKMQLCTNKNLNTTSCVFRQRKTAHILRKLNVLPKFRDLQKPIRLNSKTFPGPMH